MHMAIDIEIASRSRLLAIDGNGHLHAVTGDPLDVTADTLYAVVVLWDRHEGLSWMGWLSTTTHRSACFSSVDLEDPIVQSWLRALPGWDHAKLWHATTTPGFHLVWRRA
jgi:hypothetical protein